MRVLMVAQFFPPTVGGEEQMVASMGRELVARGHEVSIATLRVAGAPTSEVVDGMRVHRVQGLAQRAGAIYAEAERPHAVPIPDPLAARALTRIVRAERPQIVHGHNWLVHSYVPLAPVFRAPLVLSLHDYSVTCSVKRLMRRGVRCAGPGPVKCVDCARHHYGAKGVPIALGLGAVRPGLRRAVDLFLPVSRAVADGTGIARNGWPFDVLPNFLPRTAVASPDTEVDVPGLPDAPFALFVGDLSADKGVDVLLDAQARLEDPMPIVLIGRPYSERLLASPPGVIVLGPRPHPQVMAAWRRCAVGLVPSTLPEPFGLVALEAMATGRPVIASRVGGLPEVVEDGVSGLLVEPGDADALAQALARLTTDTELRRSLGDNARTRARAFTPDEVVPRLEGIYRRLVAEAGVR